MPLKFMEVMEDKDFDKKFPELAKVKKKPGEAGEQSCRDSSGRRGERDVAGDDVLRAELGEGRLGRCV